MRYHRANVGQSDKDHLTLPGAYRTMCGRRWTFLSPEDDIQGWQKWDGDVCFHCYRSLMPLVVRLHRPAA